MTRIRGSFHSRIILSSDVTYYHESFITKKYVRLDILGALKFEKATTLLHFANMSISDFHVRTQAKR